MFYPVIESTDVVQHNELLIAGLDSWELGGYLTDHVQSKKIQEGPDD